MFAVGDGDVAAIIDTQLQMRAFEKALEKGLILWLSRCSFVRRNARLGTSVIDYLLDWDSIKTYLEVKSAVLCEGSFAMYPDCPTARGRRHIRELTDYAKAGGRAIILFIAALGGVNVFKPDKASDPELAELLLIARNSGVEIKAINIVYNPADSFIYLENPDMRTDIG